MRSTSCRAPSESTRRGGRPLTGERRNPVFRRRYPVDRAEAFDETHGERFENEKRKYAQRKEPFRIGKQAPIAQLLPASFEGTALPSSVTRAHACGSDAAS